MQRKALVIAAAAGPEDVLNGVLQRFSFAPVPTTVPTITHAWAKLRDEHFDLVFVPLQDVDAVDLATLEREVRKGRSTYVIGTAPQADSDLMLRALRSGVHEFVLHPPDPKELTGAVDRLLRRGHTEIGTGTTVAVHSAKGGLGTTSVALNLAHAFARNNADSRVALADMVVSGGDVGVMLDLRPAYDIGDLVAKVNRIDAELLYSLLTPSDSGVWVLPAADKPEAAEAVDAAAAATIIAQLRQNFAFTVLDCEHHLSDRSLAALDAADKIVLVTQLNVPALRSTQRTLAVFQRLGYADEKVCVVVNRFQSGDVVSVTDAATVLEREIAFKIPNDYKTASGALTKGVAVGDYDAGSPLARAYTALAAKLGGSVPTSMLGGNGKGHHSRIGRLLGFRRT